MVMTTRLPHTASGRASPIFENTAEIRAVGQDGKRGVRLFRTGGIDGLGEIPHFGNNQRRRGILPTMRPRLVCSLAISSVVLGGCASEVAVRPPAIAKPAIELAPVVVSPYSDRGARGDVRARAAAAPGRQVPRGGGALRSAGAPRARPGRSRRRASTTAALAHEGLGEREAAVARYRDAARALPRSRRRARRALPARAALATSSAGASSPPRPTRSSRSTTSACSRRSRRTARTALGLVEQDQLDEAAQGGEPGARSHRGAPARRGGQAADRARAGELRARRGAAEEEREDRLQPRCRRTSPRCWSSAARACSTRRTPTPRRCGASTRTGRRWPATASGQLYQQLHRDVMQIPPPAKADTLKKKQLFEGAMRLRYRVLLEKGLKMMDGTVRSASAPARTSALGPPRARGEARASSSRSRTRRRALAKLPYTEAELSGGAGEAEEGALAPAPSSLPSEKINRQDAKSAKSDE